MKNFIRLITGCGVLMTLATTQGFAQQTQSPAQNFAPSVGIGIGTALPKATLHVNGPQYLKGNVIYYPLEGEGVPGTVQIVGGDWVGNTSSVGIKFYTSSGAGGVTNALYLLPSADVNIPRKLSIGENTKELFFSPGSYFNGSAVVGDPNGFGIDLPGLKTIVFSDHIRLTDGNFAIGSTTGNEKLEVTGNVKALGTGNIFTTGTSGYIYTTNGKMGVGMTPTATSEKLEVVGNIKATGTIIAGSIQAAGMSTGASNLSTTTGNIFTTAGKLGVGLTPTAESEKLEVAGNIKATGNAIVNSIVSDYDVMSLQGNLVMASGKVAIGSQYPNSSAERFEVQEGNIKAKGTTGNIFTTGTTGYIYTTAGKMGIGVTPTTTSEKLEVAGNIKATVDLILGSTTPIRFSPGHYFNGTTTINDAASIGIDMPGQGLVVFSDKLRVTDGNLGVGLITTNEMFEVNGNAKVSGTTGNIFTTGTTGYIYTTAGKMGVGVTPSPTTEALEVVGNIKASGALTGGSFAFSSNDTKLGTSAGFDNTYGYKADYNVFVGHRTGYTMDNTVGPFDGQTRSVFMVNNQARNSNPLLFGYFANNADHNSISSNVSSQAQLGINTTELLQNVALTVKGGIAITNTETTATSASQLGIATTLGKFSLYAQDGVVSPSYFIAHRCMWDNNGSDCPGTWGDYVFEDDYELTPLSEVHNYVKKNKHLPGVPSAEEVMNGYELHGMNKNFVVKIEELTLYAIEQNQQITEQRKEIEILKGQISEYEKLATEVAELKALIKGKN